MPCLGMPLGNESERTGVIWTRRWKEGSKDSTRVTNLGFIGAFVCLPNTDWTGPPFQVLPACGSLEP